MVHRPLANDLCHQEVGQELDLARLQRGRWVGHACRVRFQVGLGLAVAAPVAVRKLVEGRHLGVEPPAFDDRDQSAAIELALAQVRARRHLAVRLPPVSRPAVTGLAVSFLLVEPQALRDVRRVDSPRLGLPLRLLLALRRRSGCNQESGGERDRD